jgi:hypothetical protein
MWEVLPKGQGPGQHCAGDVGQILCQVQVRAEPENKQEQGPAPGDSPGGQSVRNLRWLLEVGKAAEIHGGPATLPLLEEKAFPLLKSVLLGGSWGSSSQAGLHGADAGSH